MKLAVSDYDNTLYQNFRVSREDVEAINAYEEAGHRFVIASGRSAKNIIGELDHHEISSDYVIGNNGAIITDRVGNVLFNESITLDDMEKLYRDIRRLGAQVIFCSDGMKYATKYMKPFTKTHLMTFIQVKIRKRWQVDALSDLDSIIQVSVATKSNKQAIKVSEWVNEHYPTLDAYPNNHFIDIVSKGINKAKGIERLVSMLEEPVEDVMVFGDGYNDLDMFKEYKGYAVKGSVKEIVDLSHETVGNIREILNRYTGV